MMRWAIQQREHPVAIRVPGVVVESRPEAFDADYSELNRYRITRQGSRVAILALGSFYGLGESVVAKLQSEAGVNATLINPRYITGLDVDMLESLKKEHQVVVTLEDGVLDGGFGEKIARYYGDASMRVLNFGLRKEFVDRYVASELMQANRLTDSQIVADILASLN